MRFRMGDLVELVTETNSDLKYGLDDIVGVTLEKQLIPTIANLTQTKLDDFIIVHPKDFVYNPRTHGKKIGLGFNTTERCFITTWNNNTFRIKPEKADVIIPEYLYMHFLRERWDKEACFNAWGSSTVVLLWSSFCNMELYIPSIDVQRKIVHDYQVVTDRISLLRRLIECIDRTNEVQLSKLFSEARESGDPKSLKLGDFVSITRGVSYVPEETVDKPTKGYIPILRANNIVDGILIYDDLTYVMVKNVKPKQMVTDRSIIIAMSSGSQAHVGKVAMAYDDMEYSYGAFCAMITIDKAYEGIISTYLKGPWFKSHLEQVLLGTTINNIKREDIEELEIAIPSQEQLNVFEKQYQVTASYKASIVKEFAALKEVQKLLVIDLAKGA